MCVSLHFIVVDKYFKTIEGHQNVNQNVLYAYPLQKLQEDNYSISKW